MDITLHVTFECRISWYFPRVNTVYSLNSTWPIIMVLPIKLVSFCKMYRKRKRLTVFTWIVDSGLWPQWLHFFCTLHYKAVNQDINSLRQYCTRIWVPHICAVYDSKTIERLDRAFLPYFKSIRVNTEFFAVWLHCKGFSVYSYALKISTCIRTKYETGVLSIKQRIILCHENNTWIDM